MKYTTLAGLVLAGSLTGIPLVLPANAQQTVQQEESRDAMLQRLSTQSGFSIERLVQIEEDMKRPVRESLPPSENVIYLQSWQEYQQAQGYVPPAQWTRREEWNRHLELFREYVKTIHSSFENCLNNSSDRQLSKYILFLHADSSISGIHGAPINSGSRGLASVISSLTSDNTSINVIGISFYDPLVERGIAQAQADIVERAFSTQGFPAVNLYNYSQDSQQREYSGSGSAGKLDLWILHYQDLAKALSSDPVLKTQ